MSDSSRAVFLSYASQDAEAARALAEALRAAGIEVWFDQAELAGGDAWDAKIRAQIAACALFVPVISEATQARLEGYFRLEWKLAAQRTHTMADAKPFLLPVVIDATRDGEAHVPAEFRAVQWTRLPRGEATPAFSSRVRSLLDGAPSGVRSRSAGPSAGGLAARARRRSVWRWPLITGGLVCAGVAAWALLGKSGAVSSTPPGVPATASPAVASRDKTAEFPRDAELRQAMALIEAINGTREDCRLAEEVANKTLALRPNDPEAVIVSALIQNTYVNRGFDRSEERFKQARSWSERALKLAPDHPDALYALGWNLTFRNADPARAITLLEQAIKLQPDRSRYYQALVYILRTEQPERALKLAREASQRFPDDALMRYQVAIVLVSMRSSLDEYETALDETLAVGPVSSALLAKARLTLLRHGDAAEAKRLLDRLPADFRLTDRPTRELYFYARATGQWETGLQALRAFPGDWLRDFSLLPKRMLIGDLLAWQGKPELARREYEAALIEIAREKARDSQADVLLPEVWTLLRLGRRDEARARVALLYESAPRPFRLAGTNPSLLNEAFVFLQMDAREQALTLLREASGHPWSRELLRDQLRLDPAMTPWREDDEINALLAPSAPPPPAAPASAKPTDAATAAPDKSLAVLPLENLSPDPENAYFTEGMHSEIIATLGRIPDLKVISRNSALAFKGTPLSLAEIAEKLGVANLVTGSVRRAGDRLRIALELRRARDEALLWTQTYDRDLKDVFAVQSEIATEVARLLQVRGSSGSFAGARYTTRNATAYDLFLRAYTLFEDDIRSLDKQKEAIGLAEEAMRLDPSFATAANLLAHANQRAFSSDTNPYTRLHFASESKRWGEETARLLPGGAGDGALSIYYSQIELDHSRALLLAENACRALPNDAQSYNYRGIALGGLGRAQDALASYQQGLKLDPGGRTYLRNALAWAARMRQPAAFASNLEILSKEDREKPLNGTAVSVFTMEGSLPASLANMTSSQQLIWLSRAQRWTEMLALADARLANTENPVERLSLVCHRIDALQRLDRRAEAATAAITALEIATRLQTAPEIGPSQKSGWLAEALTRAGRAEEAVAEASRYVEATAAARQISLRRLREIKKAEWLSLLHRSDEALQIIARLLREPSGLTVPMLRVDPVWDNLRGDLRFQALLDDPANSAPL